MNKRFLPLTLIFLSLCILAAGGLWAFPQLFHAEDRDSPPRGPGDSSSSESSFTDIDLACVGDILIHNTVFLAAQTHDEYDFRPQFIHVKPLLEKADLTIANLEVPLGGPSQKYSGYPQFNCPDAIVDALKDAGVDVVTNANNHCVDIGQAGFFRTIDIVHSKGLDIIGTRKNEQEPPYLIKTIKGVPIGLINFGYGSSSTSGTTINGLPLPASMATLLNFIDYDHLDSELEKLRTTVAAARTDGARVIIVFMHWGNEYQLRSQPPQQRVAQELADLRVDVVFGGHPHVLQEATYVPAKASNSAEPHSTLVYYSLGNFISDQRLETVNNVNTEHGMIAQVSLRHHADGHNEILHSSYTATWVNKKINPKALYEIIPVTQALNYPAAFPHLAPSDRSRLLTCQESVNRLMAGIAEDSKNK